MQLCERGAPPSSAPLLYCAVSGLLWLEREALAALLLSPDTTYATRDALHLWEVTRAIETEELEMQLDVGPNATLAHLAAAVPQPWGVVFADHRRALSLLLREVEAATGFRQLSLSEFVA